MNKLKELEKKLGKVKKSKTHDNHYNKKVAVNYSIAINISIELITGIGLGVFLGLMIDNYLQTKPLMLWIWISVILISLGGLTSLFKKKYES